MSAPPSRVWIYAGLAVAAGLGLSRWVSGPKIRPGVSRLLLVGDSMAVGLGPPLGGLASPSSIAFSQLGTVGTRIDQWADSSSLRERLASFQPNLVLVSLGTNDAFMLGGADTVERQRRAMQKLLALFQGRDVVWIGPPALTNPPNPGMLAMIKSEAPNYFPSDRLSIPRGPDGLHPTARGYAGWAGAIWQWLT